MYFVIAGPSIGPSLVSGRIISALRPAPRGKSGRLKLAACLCNSTASTAQEETMAGRPLQRLVSHLRRAAAPTNLPAPSDADLLARFAGGDQAAFELLLWRHAGMVFGVCRRVLHDEQHAEDAFQAAFLALARKAASVRRESVGGWLHRVAFRIALRARRGVAARHRRERSLGDLQPGSPQPGPCAEATASELWAVLDQELGRLPQKFYQPLVLCCLSGKSCGEAAVELGCAVGTVESRLARARRRLRAALARRGFDAPAALLAGPVGLRGVVTPALVSSTARAAVLFAAEGGAEITPAAALAEDFLRGMVMRKIEGAVAVLVLLGLSGAWLAWMGPGGPQGASAIARAPAPLPPRRPATVKTDAERIQGVWKVMQGDASGKHLPRDISTQQRWTISGEKIHIDYGDGAKGEVAYKLDPAARPRAVDLTFNGLPWRGATFLGIYDLQRDRLKIAYTRAVGQRPADFDTGREERGTVWLVLKREQPEQPAGKIDQHLRAWEQQMRKIQTLKAVLSRTDRDKVTQAATQYTGHAQYMKSGTGPSARNLALLEMKLAGKNDLAEKVICTGTFLYQFLPAQKEIRRYELPRRRPGQVADDNFLTFLFGMKADEARKRYELTLSKEDAWYIYIEVTPRLAADRATFTRARFVLNRYSYLPRRLWFEEGNGNEVTWDIPRVQTGVAVDRRVFEAPKPPRGWKLVTKPR
jgi:TIGR03009 family protein